MSDTAKLLFDGLKAAATEMIVPGLQRAGNEILSDLGKLGSHGSSELASALFNGNAFVLYGPASRSTEVEREQPTQERGGMEM